MKKILFILSEPTPYHSLLLKSFNKLNGINILVGYLKKQLPHHPWEIDNQEGIGDIFYLNKFANLMSTLLRCFFNRPDLAIIASYSNISSSLFYLLMYFRNVPFVFWGDTPALATKRSYFLNLFREIILQWIFKNSRAIFVSGKVGIDAYTALGCPKAKLRNVPFTVDLEKPLHPDFEVNDLAETIKKQYASFEQTIFIGVGQLNQRKNYAVAIRAFAKALEHGTNQNAVFLLAGDGPEKNFLESLVDSSGLAQKVHFLGWCQTQKLDALYWAGDVMIHTAQWDPYPVSILGAMAWGLPILASDQSMSAVDRIIQGESGFIHRVNDIEELAEHIRFLLDNPDAIARMGKKARATAEEWPAERNVRTILDLL